MHVVICIVGFRNSADIVNCLAAVSALDHSAFEVVICENGGAESFARLREGIPSVLSGGQGVSTLLAPRNLGYAGGVNLCLGAKTTKAADAWWILNPDTLPRSTALSALVRRLDAGDCDLVGGTLLTEDNQVESRAGQWRSWLARSERIGGGEVPIGGVDVTLIEKTASFVSGACMLASRRFVETVGPMREDYFLYCEEVEWCLRAQSRGLRLGYAKDAEVVHLGGTTTGAVGDLSQRSRTPVYLDERNKLLLTRDLYPARLFIAAPAALILLLIRYGKRGAWRQVGYAASGWLAGIRNRRGPPSWVQA